MIIAVLGCAPITERLAVRNLKLKFKSVQVASLDFQGVTLKLHWDAYNPNPVDAVLDGFDVDIFANGTKIGHARTTSAIRVPAHSSREIVLPLRLRWRTMSKTVQDGIRRKKLSFRGVGFAVMNTPLGKVRFKVVDRTANIW